jgi:hypothetical protein
MYHIVVYYDFFFLRTISFSKIVIINFNFHEYSVKMTRSKFLLLWKKKLIIIIKYNGIYVLKYFVIQA